MAPIAPVHSARCRLCAAEARWVGMQRILTKYDADYFQCPNCDLLQTEAPYWLKEAPWSSIAHLDTGAVTRHGICERVTMATAQLFEFGPQARCMDYGAGSGLLVRAMRDHGFDFRWWDLYAQNIFARGLEAKPDERCDLVTAFEFFEHLPTPGDELAPLFEPGHSVILAGTVLHSGYRSDWWYFVPVLGGHVAFYSSRTMQHIGDRWGYQVIATPQHTAFYRPSLSSRQRRVLERVLREPHSWVARLLATEYSSLIGPDFDGLLPGFLSGVPGATISSPPPPRQSQRHRHGLRRRALLTAARLIA